MSKIDLRIDGDIVIYRSGYASDSAGGTVENALHNAKQMINNFKRKFNTGKATIYLSNLNQSANFRYALSDNYKAHRAKECKACKNSEEDYTLIEYGVITEDNGTLARYYQCQRCHSMIKDNKPVYYKELRKYLIEVHKAKVVEWGEADDHLCINVRTNSVIVSVDKDLLMCPGVHYRFCDNQLIRSTDPGRLFLSKNNKKILGTGFKWFCAQMLLGDTSDNIIKPTKGLGPVAVYNLLKDIKSPDQLWDTITKVYTDAHKSDILEINAKLLWIARKPDQIFSEDIVGELEREYREKERNISSS